MPSAQDYNTYQSPLSRSSAFAAAKEQLAGAQQNREFAAQREPYVQKEMQLSNQQREASIAALEDRLKTTSLAREVMEISSLSGQDRAIALNKLAQTSQNADFWRKGIGQPQQVQDQTINSVLQYAQAAGYLQAPEQPKAPTQPSSIKEYEFARGQGYQGSFQEFQTEQRKAGATNVTIDNASKVGTIPPGWEVFTDPETKARSMRPIAGGPAENELQAKALKQELKASSAVIAMDGVIDTVNEAIGVTGRGTAGFAALFDFIPESGPRELANSVQTIQANIGFDKLQAMRDASPTGGALGQVSERELGFLQSTLANLDTRQKPESLKKNLQKVLTHYSNWRNAVINARGQELMNEGLGEDEVMQRLAEEFSQ